MQKNRKQVSKSKPFLLFLRHKRIAQGNSIYNFKSFLFKKIIMQGQEVDVQEVQPKTITCVSAKQMKKIVKEQFRGNPEKYYPTETFRKLGFSRALCECGHYFWRKSQAVLKCGDSNCSGKYTFIGQSRGIAKIQNRNISYAQAWKNFQSSLTSAKIPCTSIDRYPVIARWRNDVDYVAAGIYCFQPFCVTGQLEPPANPLICPQFVVRFNDLDNIGLTGRHYSGFIMLGIQVFNKPDNYIFFKEECVEFNYRWLTEGLKINSEEITFVQDIWAGGGNLGPSVQYFVGGLQVGNMVFMQYKYFHDGSFQQLPVKVIDVGIGLQRIPWLLNGSPTSYFDVFRHAFQNLNSKLKLPLNGQIWHKLGPYTCKLDIDQTDDIEKIWTQISGYVNQTPETVKQAILPVKELYIILDHTRTALVVITDGGLPSNIGGGSNLRNIIRRVFAILKKNGWWQQIGGLKGFLELFECHKKDLQTIYGKFLEYKSFDDIITIEYQRWANTESGQAKKLVALIQKQSKKQQKLTIDDWINAIQSWGIPADVVSQLSNQPIPGDLYKEIDQRNSKQAKAQEQILYQTIHFPETQNLYYIDHRMYKFDAKIVAVLSNIVDKQKGTNIVILDRSAFYPTSGGQVHDKGTIKILDRVYNVTNVEKVGKCFLHHLDEAVDPQKVKGTAVQGIIDQQRRSTLRAFHTGTHIVFAACRRVLGPHIWQNGAKKTEQQAHLDVTHHSSLTKEIEMQIENQANKIILEGHNIRKYFENKKQAEKEFGFRLYQGGIVPGDTIRVVNIQDVDVEACCGTHADNTSQVGWIKMIKSTRISDGILRLYYMAGTKVMNELNKQAKIINQLKDLWGVQQKAIVGTATRFFNEYKKFEKEAQSQKLLLLGMYARVIAEGKGQMFAIPSLQKEMTLYFSSMNTHLVPIIENDKSVIFVTDSFIYGIISKAEHIDLNGLKAILKEDKQGEQLELVQKKFIVKKGIQIAKGKGKDKIKKQNAFQINYAGKVKDKKIMDFLIESKFEQLK